METNVKFEQLLACLVHLIGRAVMPPEKVLEIIGSRRAQLKTFNLCDGSRTQQEIVKKARIDQGNFSRTLARWMERGIVFRIGEGKEAKPLHVYPISKNAKPRGESRAAKKRVRRAARG